MLGSFFKYHKLPTGYKHDMKNMTYFNEEIVEEFIYYLRGEPYRQEAVDEFFRSPFAEEYKDYSASFRESNLKSYTDSPVTVKGDENSFIFPSLAVLRRRFHLIDDLIVESEIELPFPLPYLICCLTCNCYAERCRVTLKEAMPILNVLRPKDPLYYFRFDTKGSAPEDIKTLAENLTEENKKDIMEGRKLRKAGPLPWEEGIVAAILERWQDEVNLEVIFHSNPSYLLYYYSSGRMMVDASAPDRARELLLTASFGDRLELVGQYHRERVQDRLIDLLSTVSDVGSMERVLAMLNLPIWEGRRPTVTLPSGLDDVDYAHTKLSFILTHFRTTPCTNIGTVLSMSEESVREKILACLSV